MSKAARLTEMRVVKAFTWAHEGVRVQSHEPDEVILAEEDLVDVARERGWAEPTGNAVPLEGKAKAGAVAASPRKAAARRAPAHSTGKESKGGKGKEQEGGGSKE